MENIVYWFSISELIGAILLMKFKLKSDRFYWITLAIAGAIALASAISKWSASAKQKKLAGQISPDDPTYVADPNIAANQGLATTLFNGRMAGAADEEKNILGSQASTFGQINRNAGSGSQALALAEATQGQTNSSFNKLGIQEAQNKYALAQQLYNANTAEAGENYKVYQDKLRKFGNDTQAKIALTQAAANNSSGAFSDLASAAYAGASAYGSASGGAGINSNIGGANVGRVGTYNSGGQPNSLYPWMSYQTQGWNAAPTGGNPNVYPGAGQPYFDSVTGTWHK